MTTSLLYRGPLASCNFDCSYCPYALRASSVDELTADRTALRRFVDWVRAQRDPHAILFTPWGEALIRSWYREALVELSRMPQVERVAIQTNLACRLDWLNGADLDCLALWISFHPSQVGYDAFLGRCRALDAIGVRFSVGLVGLREHLEVARALRRDLPESVYLWINAYKSEGPDYYRPGEAPMFAEIDPLFPLSDRAHESRGESCRTGASVFSVDGNGDLRRCHFVDEKLGNLYDDGLDPVRAERRCPNDSCHCHIGYVHLDPLDLYPVFGGGLLERIPAPRVPAQRRPAVLPGQAP